MASTVARAPRGYPTPPAANYSYDTGGRRSSHPANTNQRNPFRFGNGPSGARIPRNLGISPNPWVGPAARSLARTALGGMRHVSPAVAAASLGWAAWDWMDWPLPWGQTGTVTVPGTPEIPAHFAHNNAYEEWFTCPGGSQQEAHNDSASICGIADVHVFPQQTWTGNPALGEDPTAYAMYYDCFNYFSSRKGYMKSRYQLRSGHSVPALGSRAPVWNPYQPAVPPETIPGGAPVAPPGLPRYLPDPFQLPINTPSPEIRPLPWRDLPGRHTNPNRNPREQPQRGPNPRPLPRPDPLNPLNPGPTISEEHPMRPTPRGRTERNPDNRPKPRVNPRPDYKPPRPPRPHEKEKKKIMAVGGVAGRMLNWATEGKDLLDALHDALPDKLQAKGGKRALPHAKALALWKGFESVDWEEAAWNIAKNQVEDYAFGKLGKLGREANRNLGFEHGVQFGPAM